MLCPYCGKRTDSRQADCQHCGKRLRAPHRKEKTPVQRGAYEAPLRVYGDEEYLRTTPKAPETAAGDAGAPALHRQRADMPPEQRAHGDGAMPAPSARRRGASAPPQEAAVRDAARRGRGSSTPAGATTPEEQRAHSSAARTQAQANAAKPMRVRHSPRRQAVREMDHERLKQMQGRKPVRRKRVKWAPLMGGILLFAIAVGVSTTLLLTQTATGQQQLAAWGYDVPANAYMSLGETYLNSGEITKSITAYERAREIEPDSVEAALDLASVYEIDGRKEDAITIYEELMHTLAPQHVEAYTRMIRIYREAGEAQAAVDLMKLAYETTGSESFEIMRREYMPSAPAVSAKPTDATSKEFALTNNKATEPFDVTLAADEGAQIYYTLDESDPMETGTAYKAGDKIHFEEGTTRLRAIAISETGVPSEEVDELYHVIIKTPDAPKANYASGKYQRVINVSLRAGDDIVAMYYTLDGTSPTTESLPYTGPITLPLGKSTLKAIAISDTGKQSYEMTVTYEITGTQKRIFNSKDAFKDWTLMKTKYAAFKKKYGEPLRYEAVTDEKAYGTGTSYEAVYEDKVARFVETEEGKDAVLYYLETRDSSMTGPRKTKVGAEEMDVLDAFRDKGGMPINERGDRLLYNIDSLGKEIGTYRVQEDGGALIQYFYPADDNIFVELAYTIEEGVVTSILWQRYIGVTQ